MLQGAWDQLALRVFPAAVAHLVRPVSLDLQGRPARRRHRHRPVHPELPVSLVLLGRMDCPARPVRTAPMDLRVRKARPATRDLRESTEKMVVVGNTMGVNRPSLVNRWRFQIFQVTRVRR